MNTIKRYLLLVLFFCVSLLTFSQAAVYPVQLSAVMLPPYTNCMGDYFSNGRVQLKAIVRDMSRYDETLEYTISVKIKQGSNVVLSTTSPIKRQFGKVQIVNDISVKELFSDRKAYTVHGNSRFFDNGYCLEEGVYEFEYQLFDKNKGNLPLSEPFSVYCNLSQAEPPVGVFPENGKCYEPHELPQKMLFQWIDPIAIGPQNRTYELHIKENGTDFEITGNMFSEQEAPGSMELYNQTTFNNNFVLIDNTAGKFKENNKYYWYVQTKSVADGIHGQNAYKNNGNSKTYSFSVGNCQQEEPTTEFDDSKAKKQVASKVKVELNSVKLSDNGITAEWELKSNKKPEFICGFKVYCYKVDGGNPDDASEVLSYRLKSCENFKEGDSWNGVIKSSVLEKGVEYFFFVRPVLQGDVIGLKSNELSFKTETEKASASKSNDDDDCKVDLESRPCEDLLKEKPKFFFANDGHQVVCVDLNNTKLEGGVFTGSGIITPAWLKNMVPDILPITGLNVEFEKIKVNSDGYLCEGEIKVVSDPDENLYFDLNELLDFKAGSTKAPKQKEVFTMQVDKEEDISGEKFNGQVVHVKETGVLFAVSMEGVKENVGTCLPKKDYCPVQYRGALNDKGIYVYFDVDQNLNGSDSYSPYIDKKADPFTAENIRNGYVTSGSDYIQPWISMVQGDFKYVKAYFNGQADVDPNDVDFYLISKNSLALLEKHYVTDGNYFKVKIYGGQPQKSLQIVARSKAKKKGCSNADNNDEADSDNNDDANADSANDSSNSANGESNKSDKSNCNECDECLTYGSAQIFMLSYDTIKVMLVPVVNSLSSNKVDYNDLKVKVSEAQKHMNKMFAPLGKHFILVQDTAFEYPALPETGFNVTIGNSDWKHETDEMVTLRKNYGLKVGKRKEYNACVFLLPQADTDNLLGYMPRSNSVGFVFVGESYSNIKSVVLAHELCHGIFGLQHTFCYSGVNRGDVKENLMDYADNDERYLSKYFQWHNMETFNGHAFSLLDDTEDGALIQKLLKCTGKALAKTAISESFDRLFLCFFPQPEKSIGTQLFDASKNFVFQTYDDCKDEFHVDYDNAMLVIKALVDGIECYVQTGEFVKCVCGAGIDIGINYVRDIFISKKINNKFKSLKKLADGGDKEAEKTLKNIYWSTYGLIDDLQNKSVSFDIQYYAQLKFLNNSTRAIFNNNEKNLVVDIIKALLTGDTDPLKEYCPGNVKKEEISDELPPEQDDAQPNKEQELEEEPCIVEFTSDDINRLGLPLDSKFDAEKGYVYFDAYCTSNRLKANIVDCKVNSVAKVPDYTIVVENDIMYVYLNNKKVALEKAGIKDYTVICGQICMNGELVPIESVYPTDKCLAYFVKSSFEWLNKMYTKNSFGKQVQFLKGAPTENEFKNYWKDIDKTMSNNFKMNNQSFNTYFDFLKDNIDISKLYNRLIMAISNCDKTQTHEYQLKLIIRTIASYLGGVDCDCTETFKKANYMSEALNLAIMQYCRETSVQSLYSSANRKYTELINDGTEKSKFELTEEDVYTDSNYLKDDRSELIEPYANLLSEFLINLNYKEFSNKPQINLNQSFLSWFMKVDSRCDPTGTFQMNTFPYALISIK